MAAAHFRGDRAAQFEQIAVDKEEAGEAVLADEPQLLLQALFDTLRNAPIDESIPLAGGLAAHRLEIFVSGLQVFQHEGSFLGHLR